MREWVQTDLGRVGIGLGKLWSIRGGGVVGGSGMYRVSVLFYW